MDIQEKKYQRMKTIKFQYDLSRDIKKRNLLQRNTMIWNMMGYDEYNW